VAEERLRIVASLVRATGDFDLAEDCLQDAVERALEHWPRDVVPDNPAAARGRRGAWAAPAPAAPALPSRGAHGRRR
jgi:predicted RNA polymerase sigma factor